MLFFTSFAIFSFCFIFYIIWNQFLRKDTRLSIGLKVLQKKMDLLQNFSERTDTQLRKGIELLDKKNKELEKIVSEARFCIFKMEKLTMNLEEGKNNSLNRDKKMTLIEDPAPPEKNDPPLKLKKRPRASSQKRKEENSSSSLSKKFDFGESPFSHIGFVENKSKKDKAPPYDPSPDA